MGFSLNYNLIQATKLKPIQFATKKMTIPPNQNSVFKNWAPVFIFIICLILYFTNSVYPSTGFSFYLLLISSIILLISAILNFVNERINVGCLQILILVITIFLIGFGLLIKFGVERRTNENLSQEKVTSSFKIKTPF